MEYMTATGSTPYKAAKHFSEREGEHFSESMFRQWKQNGESIICQKKSRKRTMVGGRKPKLGDMEDLIRDEVVELRISKQKVTRAFIADRARMLAAEIGVNLKATDRWLRGFMSRYKLIMRRTTNLTTLSDETLIQRAVDYMTYLRSVLPGVDFNKTLLMDETAVYFEDNRAQTVDFRGRKHVIMKSTGFASMRVTVVASVWANGQKAAPMIIHKSTSKRDQVANGKGDIQRVVGPLLYTTQVKIKLGLTRIC